MSSRPKVTIDESKIKEMVAFGLPPSNGFTSEQDSEITIVEDEPTPKTEKVKRVTKDKSEKYRDKFFPKYEFGKRKMIYVSSEMHKKLTVTVTVAGGDKSNLSSYVENIIREHFERNKEAVDILCSDGIEITQ